MNRLVLAALFFIAGFAAHTLADIQRLQVSARTILESDVKGGVMEQAIVQVYEFPAGATLPWRIHPDAHEVAYILDGALTLEIEG